MHPSFFLYPYSFFPLFCSFFFFYVSCIFWLSRGLAAAKLRPAASEGGASSNSRLQRCMRRARSLQQRMQLQQRPQDSEAVRQHPEQQQEEEQQLQEQPRYHKIGRACALAKTSIEQIDATITTSVRCFHDDWLSENHGDRLSTLTPQETTSETHTHTNTHTHTRTHNQPCV